MAEVGIAYGLAALGAVTQVSLTGDLAPQIPQVVSKIVENSRFKDLVKVYPFMIHSFRGDRMPGLLKLLAPMFEEMNTYPLYETREKIEKGELISGWSQAGIMQSYPGVEMVAYHTPYNGDYFFTLTDYPHKDIYFIAMFYNDHVIYFTETFEDLKVLDWILIQCTQSVALPVLKDIRPNIAEEYENILIHELTLTTIQEGLTSRFNEYLCFYEWKCDRKAVNLRL